MILTIRTKEFFNRKKANVMKSLGISERAYNQINAHGIPKGPDGKPLAQFEIEIPDSEVMGGQPALPSLPQQAQMPLQQNFGQVPQVHPQLHHLIDMAEYYQHQAEEWLDRFAQRQTAPDATPDELDYYLQKHHECEQKMLYYGKEIEKFSWSETCLHQDSNGMDAYTKAVNAPYSNWMMGLGAVHEGISVTNGVLSLIKNIKDLFGRSKDGNN